MSLGMSRFLILRPIFKWVPKSTQKLPTQSRKEMTGLTWMKVHFLCSFEIIYVFQYVKYCQAYHIWIIFTMMYAHTHMHIHTHIHMHMCIHMLIDSIQQTHNLKRALGPFYIHLCHTDLLRSFQHRVKQHQNNLHYFVEV